MNTIKVLQLGSDDFRTMFPVPSFAEWYYEPIVTLLPEMEFEVVIVDREINQIEYAFLMNHVDSYRVFSTNESVFRNLMCFTGEFMMRKAGQLVTMERMGVLLTEELQDYFGYSYGEKFRPGLLTISSEFHGRISWTGFVRLDLEGEFGQEFRQTAFWRNYIPIDAGQTCEFWLEYEKDGAVDIELEVTLFRRGSISDVMTVMKFSEKDLQELVYVSYPFDALAFVSLNAKGSGRFSIFGFHNRHSRRGKGCFVPGGKRFVTSDREEVFYYFDPGNMKPPFNVYFSGYKTREGFEGQRMMRNLGQPFLLIAEARLEGGGFYMGSEEYENGIVRTIEDHLKRLEFDRSEMILSGLSMGTFGALYYGSFVKPGRILIGKPLASLGDVAGNERLWRPGGFPTSLDVLMKACGSIGPKSVKLLNERFWKQFEKADWSGVTFAVSYMLEDDYDRTAYENLCAHLKDKDVMIYGKGIHGRHNDDTNGIVGWFIKQYRRMIGSYGYNRKE